jgi:hypothetical protein
MRDVGFGSRADMPESCGTSLLTPKADMRERLTFGFMEWLGRVER